MTIEVMLPGTLPGKVQRRIAPDLETARRMVAAAISLGRRQPLRPRLISPTEEVYTVPSGRHAAIEIRE